MGIVSDVFVGSKASLTVISSLDDVLRYSR